MQGKDNLEDFIQENRAAFDLKTPRDQVWSSIEKEIEPRPSNQLWYWKAAVILLIGAVTFLLIDRSSVTSGQLDIDEQQAAIEVASLEKFQELETFYTSIISNKVDKVSVALEEGNEFDYLVADIKSLDLIYHDLKDVFLESQQSEEVLDRLMHILRQKIHLINSQLDILERDILPEAMKKDVGVSM